MKHIADTKVITSGLQTKSTETLSPRLNQVWVDALFKKFKVIYGTKFTAQFHTDKDVDLAKDEWAQALAGLSGERIKRAIDKCRDELSWQPTIAEFLKASKDSDYEHKTGAYRLFISKPIQGGRADVKNEAIGKIRDILKKKNPENLEDAQG